MLGHYLLSLSPAAEDAVLTSPMAPGHYVSLFNVTRCLVGTAAGARAKPGTRFGVLWDRPGDRKLFAQFHTTEGCVEARYDILCKRFGTERINTAIRGRVLMNRLRRALVNIKATEAV